MKPPVRQNDRRRSGVPAVYSRILDMFPLHVEALYNGEIQAILCLFDATDTAVMEREGLPVLRLEPPVFHTVRLRV